MTTPHPAFMTAHPPGLTTFPGFLMLKLASPVAELRDVQREVVHLVTSGQAGRRFNDAADDAVDDTDEALLLLQDLLREHDRAVGESSADFAAFTAAESDLHSECAIVIVPSHLDRGGAHSTGRVLLDTVPHVTGYLTVEEEALESAILNGRLVLGIGTAEQSSDTKGLVTEVAAMIAEIAVEVFRAHGLTARLGAGADEAIILEDLCLANPRSSEGAVGLIHMRGPRYEVIPPEDVTVETFRELLTHAGLRTHAEPHAQRQAPGQWQSPPVRVWDGFGWMLEVDADTVRFGHLQSGWQQVAPRGADEEIARLVTMLLTGDIRTLREHVMRDPRAERRSRVPASPSSSTYHSAPLSARHPAFATVYPPDTSTFAGSLMLMVASALDRTYDELQAAAAAAADEGKDDEGRAEDDDALTPEEALLLLDDVLDMHNEAVGMLVIDQLRVSRAFMTTAQRRLVMGLPHRGHPTGREAALLSLESAPGSIGCVWTERHDLEQAVLTRALGLTVAGNEEHPGSLEMALAQAEQHFRAHGFEVGRVASDSPATARLVLEPFDWALTHDLDEVREQRVLWGPRRRGAAATACGGPGTDLTTDVTVDGDVTAEAVMNAVRHAGRGTRPADHVVEVWTGRGWQLDIEHDVVRLTHRRSPRVHVRARPSAQLLRTCVDHLLAGDIARLLELGWEVTAPGSLERRRPGHRGPNMRMHPVAALPYPQEEGTFTGMIVQDVARGLLDAAEVRQSAATALLDDPDDVFTGHIPTVFEGVLLADEIIRAHHAAGKESDSSVPAFAAAAAALEATGIVVALGAADVSDGHHAGQERAAWFMERDPQVRIRGYAFSHDQDLDRAVHSGELYVGFGAVPDSAVPDSAVPESAVPESAVPDGDVAEDGVAEGLRAVDDLPDPAADVAIAAEVVAALQDAGLAVDWDGTAGARIVVSPIAWVTECSDPRGDGEPELRGRWGDDYVGADEATVEEFSRKLDEIGSPDEAERNVVELTAGSGWTLEVDPEQVRLGHLDVPVLLQAPRPDRAALIAMTQSLLEGDVRALLAREWVLIDLTAEGENAGSADSGGAEVGCAEAGGAAAPEPSFRLTDRWGVQVDAPGELASVLALFTRFYDDLDDDGADLEHTVVSVESSEAWYLEFSATKVRFGSAEEDGHDLDTPLEDAEIAASLVRVLLTEGPASVADIVRAGPLGRRTAL